MENSRQYKTNLTLKALLADAIQGHDESSATILLQDYNKNFVLPEVAFGTFKYAGHENDYPEGVDAIANDETMDENVRKEKLKQLISHCVTKLSLDKSSGDAIVKIEVAVFKDTKAGAAIFDILSGKNANKRLSLVSNVQPINDGKSIQLRIVSFDFVAIDREGN